MNAIEISGLNVTLDKFALKDINLTLPKGTILGLIGRNGAGKTTLIKSVAHLYRFDSGEVRIFGREVTDDEVSYRKELGIVSDGNVINPFLKLSKLRKILKKHPCYNDDFFMRMLERFRIPLDSRISKLSLGTQKKINIFTMMSLMPRLLILDEPTSGIDPADKAELIEIFQEYMLNEENAIIFSTHITGDLDRIADYIALIDDGKLKMFTTKDDLIGSHYLVNIPQDKCGTEVSARLIGKREGHFGVEGLTADRKLIDELGLEYAKPNIEQIMVYYLNNYKNGGER